MDRNRPLIGICAYELPVDFGAWKAVESVTVPSVYTRSVLRAGGLPIVLAPIEGAAGELVELLDGLVLTGGSDIDPTLYGADPHAETVGVVGHRDRAELALLGAALERDLPVLGICRGMQVLNVARGGTLHQHLADLGPHADRHKGPPGTYTRHEVTVLEGTRLASVLGAGTTTHSCHHQAPDRIGRGLVVSAESEDGTVEAIEDPERRLVLGVLWHPEEDAERGRPLFEAQVAGARERRSVAA